MIDLSQMARKKSHDYLSGKAFYDDPILATDAPHQERDMPELPEEEKQIFAALSSMEMGVDQLIETTGLPAASVTTNLLKLEMKRLVRPMPGFRYVRRD